MPHRTRNHILEERSFSSLTNIFPSSWLVHRFDRDYGIDIQVEVFTDSGSRTGIRFYGQLKATDKEENNDSLALDHSHFEYWLAHTDPVALFRYFDKTKKFRWCWLHDVCWLIKPDKKYIDVAGFLKEWDPIFSPSEIEKYLNDRRNALFASLTPPYEISVDQGEGNDSSLLAAKIAKQINLKNFKIIPKEISEGHFQLFFSTNKIVSRYSGLTGSILEHEKGLTDEELASYALLVTFFCACRYERIVFARLLITQTLPLLYSAAVEELRLQFFDALIFVIGIKNAVELLSPLLNEELDSSWAWGTFFIACAKASWKYGDKSSWILLLQEWVEKPPIQDNVGAFSYSLANALANEGRWEEAIVAYNKALTFDSDYINKSYFWVELGAANFETQRFIEACHCYERAIHLENSPSNHWRIGDVFFHLGQISKAINHLEIALSGADEYEQNYIELLLLVCNELRDVWGLESQPLSNIEECDYKALDSPMEPLDKNELISHLKPFFIKNAIDALLNFNAGVLASRYGHWSIAAYRFLICSLMQRGDAQAWTNAIMCAFNSKDTFLMSLAAKAAHFYLREDFLPWVCGKMPGSPQIPEEMAETWRSIVIEVIKEFEKDEMTRKNKVPILRIHSQEGTLILNENELVTEKQKK